MSVYFIADSHGRVKIGYTDDLAARLSGLQSGNADTLRVIRVLDGGWPTERWLHKRFSDARLHGEWFNFHPDMWAVLPPDEMPQRRTVRPKLRLTLKETIRDQDAFGLFEGGRDDRLICVTLMAAFSPEDAADFIQWARARTGMAEPISAKAA